MGGGSTEIRKGDASAFPKTHWDMVRDASDTASPTQRQSMQELMLLYWRPVYAFFRRKWGKSNEEAKDLTQEFFATLWEKGFLRNLDPERGGFRSYVMRVLDNFTRREYRKSSPLGPLLPVDAASGFDVPMHLTPQEVFMREWTAAVMNAVLEEIERDYRARGQGDWFDLFALHDLDPPQGERMTYENLARRFGIKVTDVTNRLYRVRQAFRRLVLEKMRDLSASDEEVIAEMRRWFGPAS